MSWHISLPTVVSREAVETMVEREPLFGIAKCNIEAFTLAEQVPEYSAHDSVEQHGGLVPANLDIRKEGHHVCSQHHDRH